MMDFALNAKPLVGSLAIVPIVFVESARRSWPFPGIFRLACTRFAGFKRTDNNVVHLPLHRIAPLLAEPISSSSIPSENCERPIGQQ
jgi:hypothetical protein